MKVEQQQAARAVDRVHRGASLDDALAAVDDRSPRRGRTLVAELAYGTLRHWGTLDAIARRLEARSDTEPLMHALVAVALYQLDHTRAPAFAVVDRAVEAAAELSTAASKRWVNAVLRRYLREKQALTAQVASDEVARWSHPRWWIARVKADFPQQWQSILEAGNVHPPLTLRVNRRTLSRDDFLAVLAAQEIGARPIGEAGAIVDPSRPVSAIPGFADGVFSVQDAAAQWAAPLLDVADGMRVLDACAAPGGKTAHLAELADVAITALDRDAARLAKVTANLERLRLQERVRALCGDARDPSGWWDQKPFERILADVPCSASGVVRRHPDAKWLRKERDIAAFARDQRRILDALWPLVARGGKLLYATCSVFGAENAAQMDAFLARHPDALRETITFSAGVPRVGGQLLPSTSATGHNQDGFFYALVRKA